MKAIETKCIHSGTMRDEKSRGLITPIYTSSSFEYIDADENVYPRYFNTPNQKAVAQKLASMENGEKGLLFSSGMAAIMTTLFSSLKSGDHAIFQNDLYGGTHHAVIMELERFGIEYTFVDAFYPEQIPDSIRNNTKLIYIETPSNPLLKIIDIERVVKIAKDHNLLTIIDNTFASPINQLPIDLGIDISLHSGTKYLGGHSDLCCGALVTNKSLFGIIEASAANYGGSLNAITCYLLERSLKTLSIRVEKQTANAIEVAGFLADHPKVVKVHYPGLVDHPNHDIAKKQMKGFGGMLSFELDGDINASNIFAKKLKLITPAMSLGGVETIMSSPAQTSHSKIGKKEREKMGIKDGLVRLSIGIEGYEDLIEDLDQALISVNHS